MLNKEWLSSIRCYCPLVKGNIVGLSGIGAEWVVFSCEIDNGERHVLKLRRHHLGFHIREVPLILSGTPMYDVDRLNRKLFSLIDNPYYDQMTVEYDRMFGSVLKNIFLLKDNLKKLDDQKWLGFFMYCQATGTYNELSFLFHTESFKFRLREISTLSKEIKDPRDYFLSVNSPTFRIDGIREEIINWASNTLELTSKISLNDESYSPKSLLKNPLFIWGGAVMDYFFTDEELPKVIEFIESKFGRIPKRDDAFTLIQQISAIARLMVCFLDKSKVERLVKFCAMTGVILQIPDSKGNLVIDGTKYWR